MEIVFSSFFCYDVMISMNPYAFMSAAYHTHRARALRFIRDKVRLWNTQYQFSYSRVTVRNQSTRWGSCSSQGTLSFHYRLLFLPEHLTDYVIVHELCHLRHMNHSLRFWREVARTIPDYRRRRHELRRYQCG